MCFSYDSNQVGSNHPVEDHRAEGRISTRNPVVGFRPKNGRAAFSSVSDPDLPTDDPAYVFGIFDGHGGPACAAYASKRLFDYIAAYALGSEDQNAREALNILHNATPAQSPKLTQLLRRMYFSGEPKQEQEHTERLKSILDECIRQPVPRREDGSLDWQVILHRSFHRLDDDISRAALASIQAPAANGHANGSNQHHPHAAASDASKQGSEVVDIEPLTIALSGSVATLALLQHNELHVAQIGDSGAVLGQYDAQSDEESLEALSAAIIGSLYQNFTFPRPISSGSDASGADDISASEFQSVYSACIQIFETYLSRWRAIRITEEHKASNEREVLRIRNAHPKSESGTVLRSERLLGQLIPLRAFGDFQLKWPHNTVVSALQKFRAYLLSRSPDWTPKVGTPQYYYSPPYLTASPELLTHKLSERDRFLIMASDGLWDMMSPIHSVRLVATQLLLRSVLDRVSQMDLEGLSSLARINRVLQALLNTRAMLPTNSATLLLRNAIRTAIEHPPGGNEFSASPFSFSVQTDPDILPPNVAAALHGGGGGGAVALSRADPDYVTSLGLTPFLAAFADQERLTAFRQGSAAASGRRVHYGGQAAVAAKPREALTIDSQEVSEELFLQENNALFKALTLPRGVARNVMDDITATVLHFRSSKPKPRL